MDCEITGNKFMDPDFQRILAETVENAVSKAMVQFNQQLVAQKRCIERLERENQNLKARVLVLEKAEKSNPAIEELEQYGRRNALRVLNVCKNDIPVDPNGKVDTDSYIIDLVRDRLHIELSPNAISRSHLVGRVQDDGKCQIIVKFARYNTRAVIFNAKKALKNYPDKIFISEDLTKVRFGAVRYLSQLRKESVIHSYWTLDGRVFFKREEKGEPELLRKYDEASIKNLFPVTE